MSGWQDISTAPKDGSPIVCGRIDWDEPIFLRWKTNRRIASARAAGGDVGSMADSYFGDPDEYDDYYYAEPYGGPTHWHPLEPFPKERVP